jgi:hypothetical protein
MARRTGGAIATLPRHNQITALAFSPANADARLLATADAENRVLFWDLSTTSPRCRPR